MGVLGFFVLTRVKLLPLGLALLVCGKPLAPHASKTTPVSSSSHASKTTPVSSSSHASKTTPVSSSPHASTCVINVSHDSG
ncbi:hypothetical protein PGT21_000650 [Puccinia graminis f. sp. tritici]|uniref:Secreted protein n=1 Tax=Puccinia graminis f. sp. tritici TaxID=56615 RepID=A0A5B0MAD5_PUCGR|nr:hypothetical protein PGT21_000650 [Puccinia graminis f. sp. tritici]